MGPNELQATLWTEVVKPKNRREVVKPKYPWLWKKSRLSFTHQQITCGQYITAVISIFLILKSFFQRVTCERPCTSTRGSICLSKHFSSLQTAMDNVPFSTPLTCLLRFALEWIVDRTGCAVFGKAEAPFYCFSFKVHTSNNSQYFFWFLLIRWLAIICLYTAWMRQSAYKLFLPG